MAQPRSFNMKSYKWVNGIALALVGLLFATSGCHEKTEKREVEVHGPDKSYEVEVEETERHDHD
jgi:hypothetical protein